MPSPHRRIGLVVDEPVHAVIELFRRVDQPLVPDARLARAAVMEGALVEALIEVANSNAHERERAAELIDQVRELLPSLPLHERVQIELLELLRRASERPLGERRQRQFELLRRAGSEGGGQTAQDLAETFDAFERTPAR